MKFLSALALVALSLLPAAAQDFSDRDRTQPISVRTGVPGTCKLGQLVYASNNGLGQNVFVCDGNNTWAPIGVAAPVTLTDAATITTDVSQSSYFRVTLAGNRTLAAPTNPRDGQIVRWEFVQDGTGSRTLTLNSAFALGTDVTAVTLTTTASKRDIMTAVYNAGTSKWYVIAVAHGY